MKELSLKSNLVKKKLKAGEVCFGTMLRILKSPQAITLCAAQGWDYLILDTEHNDFDAETLSASALLAKYEETAFFVRVPDKLYFQMAQMLDLGAEGLVLPQVRTKKEADKIIRSTKYSPWGKRGVSISEVVTRYRGYGQAAYTQWANEENMNILQIESEEGLENAEEIISTKGVDAIMIGPADLSQDMGIPGQLSHPRIEEAYRSVIQICNKYGVAPGIHLANMDLVKKWIKEGMRFVTYGYDSKFFKDGSTQALNELKSLDMS